MAHPMMSSSQASSITGEAVMQIMSALAQTMFPCPALAEFVRRDSANDVVVEAMIEDSSDAPEPERAPWNLSWFSFVLLV
jgi:hypothetical protein